MLKADFIPYGRQLIDSEDIQSVVDVLKSDYLTCGPAVQTFEKTLAEYCGAKYAIACSSGTAALHLACLAAGLSKGHEGITSPITFAASANCMVYCGAKPILADINPKDLNIDVNQIEHLINKKTKVIIPVHFRGMSWNMDHDKKHVHKHGAIVI